MLMRRNTELHPRQLLTFFVALCLCNAFADVGGPEDYQLDLVTSGGLFCRSVTIQGGYAIICNSTSRGTFDSVNVALNADNATFGLSLTPSSSLPQLKLDATTGLLLTTAFTARIDAVRPPFPGAKIVGIATFAFETNLPADAPPAEAIKFSTNGSPLQYLKANNFYCSISSSVKVGSADLPSMLVCNLPSTVNATRFQLRPAGPSHASKRMRLFNVLANASCGSKILGAIQGNSSGVSVSCDGGVGPTSNSDNGWFDNVYSILFDPKSKLPLTSKYTSFTVQAWYQNTPVQYFVIAPSGQLLSTIVSSPGDPPAIPATSLVFFKANPSSASGPIVDGDDVFLKSNVLGGYCGVTDLNQGAVIMCIGSKKDVAAEPGRYTFRFTEDLASYL